MVLLGAGDSIVTAKTGTPFSRLTILNAYSSNFVQSANQRIVDLPRETQNHGCALDFESRED